MNKKNLQQILNYQLVVEHKVYLKMHKLVFLMFQEIFLTKMQKQKKEIYIQREEVKLFPLIFIIGIK